MRGMENKAGVGAGAHHPARSPALRSCSTGSEDQEFLLLVVGFSFPDPIWEQPPPGTSRSGKFLKSVGENFSSPVLGEPPAKMPS